MTTLFDKCYLAQCAEDEALLARNATATPAGRGLYNVDLKKLAEAITTLNGNVIRLHEYIESKHVEDERRRARCAAR